MEGRGGEGREGIFNSEHTVSSNYIISFQPYSLTFSSSTSTVSPTLSSIFSCFLLLLQPIHTHTCIYTIHSSQSTTMESRLHHAGMETDLLSRLAANHLFLGQIEPFRATILALRSRNPNLARSILQTIVANGGRYENILFSSDCSPAILTYICTVELLQFNDNTLGVWSFDSNTLRLRAEFVLYVQIFVSRVLESRKEDSNLDQDELDVVNSDSVSKIKVTGVSDIDIDSKQRISETKGDTSELDIKYWDYDECLRVLNKISEVGFKRLRPDLIESESRESEDQGSSGGGEMEEGEMMCLRGVILGNAGIFEALCENIAKQVERVRGNDGGGDDSGSVVSPMVQEEGGDEDVKVLRLIQRCVQMVHLDAMKECLKKGDNDGALSHIQFLRFDYGVDEDTIFFYD
ncbi:hypothetical protein HanPSC8_Chr17g0754791 [Helianthus annuus]|nr:hypothetical protein HanPSC8_Chr17g0754791 [Helianthus annuus]